MYDAIELAKYTISKCIREKCPISNLQLQKILYYIQKEFIQAESLAFGDDIEAWRFGPVVPNTYYYFCGSGSMPIILPYQGKTPNVADVGTINRIIEEKRILDPWEMVRDTHKDGGAWSCVYNNGAGNKKIIPIQLIKEYG